MPRYDVQCPAGHLTENVVAQWDDRHVPCSTCHAPTERVWRTAAVQRDEIPGGLVIENLGHEPVTVYSHSERLRIAKERGLVERVQHVPVPGTDKSPHTTRWI